ncbi:MAG: hypothetical protein ACFFG0_53330 [Candidatus Thorarchaeota archaeon]
MLEENYEIFNGLVATLTYLHVLESFKKELGKGEIQITGTLGNEIWRNALGLIVEHAKDLDEVTNLISNHYASPKILNLLKDDSYKDAMKAINKSVKKELLEVDYNDDPVTFSDLHIIKCNCSNYYANYFKLTGKYFKVFAAFLQKDILPNIIHRDLKLRVSGSIQKYIISKNNSDLAEIPLDMLDFRHGATIHDNYSSKIKNSIKVLPRYLRYIFKSSDYKITLKFH